MSTMPTTFEELELPKALMTRIAKSSLTESILIQKHAKGAMSKAATIFISYLAATASDVAVFSKHKSIACEDVFQAIETLEFDQLIPVLRKHLNAYKSTKKDKKSAPFPDQKPEQEDDRLNKTDEPDANMSSPSEDQREALSM